MPLTSDVNRWEYVGDGVTVDFAYENLIFAATDLELYFDEVLQVGGFTVSGIGVVTGGKVTPTPVVTALVKVVIVRAVPFTQPQKFIDNEAVDAEGFEDGLNRMTILAQQLQDTIGRQVTLPAAEPIGATMIVPIVATRLGKYWGWDAILGSLVPFAAPAGTTAVSVFMAGVITAADAAAARAALDAATLGYRPAQSAVPAMTADVGAGSFFNAVTREIVTNALQTTGVIVAPGGNPRNDIVYLDRLTGAVAVETGVENAVPVDPPLSTGGRPIARIRLPVSTTQITDALIDDLRHTSLMGAGGFALKDPSVLAKAIAYTVLVADDGKLIEVDATAAPRIVTLPLAADAGNGFIVGVKKTDAAANAVIVDGNGAETIDGALTRTLGTRYDAEFYRCDGVKWHIEASTAADLRVLDRNMALTDIENTVVETTLYSFSIPANKLGTDKALRMTIEGDYLNNSGVNRTYTLKVKYGATTMWEHVTGNHATAATRAAFSMEFVLSAINSAAIQKLTGRVLTSVTTVPTTGIGRIAAGLNTVSTGVIGGDATEDSTGALTFDVTITHSAAAATISMRANTRFIELL